MALSPGRIHAGGETPHPWERAALNYVFEQLPDTDPHQVWPLHELLDPGTGRLYEIDLLVLARGGFYLVEIKSNPGVLSGNSLDWTFSWEGRRKSIECPYANTNHKAKVLAGLLDRTMGRDRPFVQPLIFVSHESVDVQLDGGAGRWPWVLTRDTIRQALVHGFDGGGSRRRVVNRPMMRQVVEALRKVGLQPAKSRRIVAGYRLARLLEEGPGYQEHLGIHGEVEGDTVRVRSYLVPHQTSVSDQQVLARAARREASVLSRIGRHPAILSYRGFKDDGPLGPAVVFEPFTDGLPLHMFLRLEPELSFDDRLQILAEVVEALGHCHRNEILHRNLSPSSVLVRRAKEGALEVRLHRFQTAAQLGHTSVGTHHVDQLAEGMDRLYQAPEALRDPSKANLASDLFSLGCLTWFLVTGQPPAPTLDERERLLEQHGWLKISAIRADLAALDEAMEFATERYPVNRADNAQEWFEGWILDKLTRPQVSPEDDPDPLEAEHGDRLAHGLVVHRSLGSGGTARVLKVRRDNGKDDRFYALKVPHNEGCAARLDEEARVLDRVRHQHIIQVHERLKLGGRQCLLLQFAGDRSLDDVLREEGTLDLDTARRYGDDLLSAVQHLEEQGITHRDIKPSNLGFTTLSKRARHLVLLDFSLAASDPSSVDAGTPEWRDPWLYTRGRWDQHADRYAAAAVLYRMLSGTRSEVAEGPEDGDRVLIEPERFDAAVRDRLAAFFRCAFARDVSERFAAAEEMRSAWVALFSQTPAVAEREEEESTPSAEALASANLQTNVEALPLSMRARNALDRAGVVTVADLLQLPRNNLSAIRGVGQKVNREIVAVAEILHERLTIESFDPFVSGFPGPRLPLEDPELELPTAMIARLADAGLTTTSDAAAAPARRIDRLAGSTEAKRLGDALRALAEAMPQPNSPEKWLHELVGPLHRKGRNKAEQRIRILLGIDLLPSGADDAPAPIGGTTAQEVADALGVEASHVHSSLQFMRERWAEAPEREALVSALLEIIGHLPPAVPLEAVARELASERNPAGQPDADSLRITGALVRLVLELRPDPPLVWRRIGSRAWVAVDPTALDGAASLGQRADELATTEPLPSTETVRRELTRLVEGTPLEGLAPDQLVALAARASGQAAASTRLELYPRGMAADRALTLSMSVLTPPGLTPGEVRDRVAARYPEAALLPDRPELDALIAVHQLRYDAQAGSYVRPGVSHPTTATIRALTRMTSAQPHQRKRRSPDAMRAQAFQDALSRGVERGRFRVVEVLADVRFEKDAVRFEEAAQSLASELGVTCDSLDHMVWRAARKLAEEQDVNLTAVMETDRKGPKGRHWELLLQLMKGAADTVVDHLLSERKRTRVLVNPGILARYSLQQPLERLVDRAQQEDGAAIILVVPCHDNTLAPTINGLLPVPAPLPGQRLAMPEDWLRNAHRAAAP